MNKKSKILVCTMPNTSLFEKAPYLELNFGSSMLCAELEEKGFFVDYYDLNILLNNYKNYNNFENEKNDSVLLSNKKFYRFYESNDRENKISKWAYHLLSCLKEEKYDYIALSIERKTKNTKVFTAATNFSVFFAKVLYEKYKCPIFVGGRMALFVYKNKHKNGFEEIFKKNPGIKINAFMTRSWAKDFVVFLDKINRKEKISYSQLKNLGAVINKRKKNIFKIAEKKTEEQNQNREIPISAIVPKYDIENKKDLFFDINNFFPEIIIKKFPEIESIKPFYIVPFLWISGCPFNCAYCKQSYVNFKYLPVKNAVDVVEKINKKNNIKYFRFYNSHINFSKEYTINFCKEIIKRKIKILFSDSANLSFVDEETLTWLKKAGCIKLWYGMETISPRLLQKMNKNLDPQKIKSGLELSAKYGIWNSVNIIVNFPDEREEEFLMLEEFIKNNKELIDCLQCYEFMLHNNTSIYENPSEYCIRIKKGREAAKGFKYDEVNGLKWEEKKKLGRQKLRRIDKIFGEENNKIYRNDYILFALSQIYNSTEKKKKIINEYIDFLKNNSDDYKNIISTIDPESIIIQK